MGTVSDMVTAYNQLPPNLKREFMRRIDMGRICEYGYEHTPNQTTIDAINDSETESFGSFREFRESLSEKR
jgi:hypothetical protein